MKDRSWLACLTLFTSVTRRLDLITRRRLKTVHTVKLKKQVRTYSTYYNNNRIRLLFRIFMFELNNKRKQERKMPVNFERKRFKFLQFPPFSRYPIKT